MNRDAERARLHRYYLAHRAEFIERARRWRVAHPAEAKASQAACRLRNKQRHRDQNAQYRATHRAELRDGSRLYRQTHGAQRLEIARKWDAAHPEKRRAYSRDWRKGHPEAHRLDVARRNARKQSASGADYTTAQHIRWRWAMWGGRCWVCGDVATETDHVKPLAKGGSHYPSNLRPICKSCNSRKRHRWGGVGDVRVLAQRSVA